VSGVSGAEVIAHSMGGSVAIVLAASGVAVTPIPDTGHNIMLGNPEAFVRATAGFLAGPGRYGPHA
jgi:pimeloyl-ACP methyl ester carboxylesterase